MSSEMIQAIVSVVAGIAALVVLWRFRNTQLAARLLQAAQAGVMASEQAKATNPNMSNEDQFEYAVDAMLKIFPEAERYFSQDQIHVAIHAFVPLANQVTAQIVAAWGRTEATAKPPAIVTPAKPKQRVNLTGLD